MEERLRSLFGFITCNVEHINGPLIEHLVATKEILKNWNASATLQNAGLFHAIYGTYGFDYQLFEERQREIVANMIGKKTEDIVYVYGACDRDFFWPQIGIESMPVYMDRFTRSTSRLHEAQLRDFCELTAANEIEIARSNPAFVDKYGEELGRLFENMEPYISKLARCAVKEVFY